jgi:hypothetical protein
VFTPQALLREEHNVADPTWSPDGHRLMFGRLPDSLSGVSVSKSISIFDLDNNQILPLPQSDGLFSPRWSHLEAAMLPPCQ